VALGSASASRRRPLVPELAVVRSERRRWPVAEQLQAGDRVVVTNMDEPGREKWVGMAGTVEEVEDPAVDLFPVLVRIDSLGELFYFAIDEIRLLYAAPDLVAVGLDDARSSGIIQAIEKADAAGATNTNGALSQHLSEQEAEHV
jgi:hypothetical protein